MFCRILKKNYGDFVEKCVGGNDVFIKKLQAVLVCTKISLYLSVRNFRSFRLSVITYKPVGVVWWGTQINNLNFKLPFYPIKIFKIFFQIRIFFEKFCSECFLSCVDKIISLKDDFTSGYESYRMTLGMSYKINFVNNPVSSLFSKK